MISLNIFLGIVISAYEHTHDNVKKLDHEDGNVFHDISTAAKGVAFKLASKAGLRGPPDGEPSAGNGYAPEGMATVEVTLTDGDSKADLPPVDAKASVPIPAFEPPAGADNVSQYFCGGEPYVENGASAPSKAPPVPSMAGDLQVFRLGRSLSENVCHPAFIWRDRDAFH